MPTRKSLRILQVINSMHPSGGGTVECVRQLADEITARKGVAEVAICADAPGAPWLASVPAQYHALGPAYGSYAFSPRLRSWLRANGGRFDAWILHGLWQFQTFGSSRVATELGVPYFVYTHGALNPWSRRAHPIKYLKKFAYWLLAERKTLASASGVIFTSPQERHFASGYFPVGRWRGYVVSHGISEPPAVTAHCIEQFKRKFEIETCEEIWLFVGRVHPSKGIDLLLEAARDTLPSGAVLLIVGEGNPQFTQRMKSRAKDLGLEGRVRWLGAIYGPGKWPAFRAASLFVLPSHQENFGFALVEALAAGVPVCTTTSVNIHPDIERDQAGLICEDNSESLRSALSRWCKLSRADRGAMSANARLCFQRNYQIGAAVDGLFDVINGVIVAPAYARATIIT